jgi:hypothetical protein
MLVTVRWAWSRAGQSAWTPTADETAVRHLLRPPLRMSPALDNEISSGRGLRVLSATQFQSTC